MEISTENRTKELLIGCGNSRKKFFDTCGSKEWQNLVTLDMDNACSPDILWNLNEIPYPLPDNELDSIHGYDVLEHCGQQGDIEFFFNQFAEFWRILKPGGRLCATVPHWASEWALGDPGHTRIINAGTLVFLSQEEYKKQVGTTQMTDYRSIWRGDFIVELAEYQKDKFIFILKAIKE